MLQTIPDWDWNKQTDEETNAGLEFISAFHAEHGYYPGDPPPPAAARSLTGGAGAGAGSAGKSAGRGSDFLVLNEPLARTGNTGAQLLPDFDRSPGALARRY